MKQQPGLSLRLPFHYGWLILGLSFLATLIGAGIRSSPAVLIHPLEEEFGWSRAAIASAAGVNLFLFGVAAPISGWLLDRFGPRVVMLGSLSLLALGVSGTVFMKDLWHLMLLWGVVVGLSAGGVGSVLSATVAHRWFVARRGLVLGILNSASSTGQLIFIPFFMAMIVYSGWRAGSLIMAAVALVVVVLVALLMRNNPSDVGVEPYGGRPPDAPGAQRLRPDPTPPVTFSMVVKNHTFWLLCASFFICGSTANGLIGTHLIPHSIDHGIPGVTAAATVGVMGGMNFIGTVISGWLTDRVDARKLLSAVYALRGLALFILPFVTDFPGLLLFAVIYGLDWFATVPPTITLTGNTFGRAAVSSIYGWIFLSHQIGAASAAMWAGAIRVAFGDYQLAFLFGGMLGLVAASLALMIPRQAVESFMIPVPARAAGAGE